MGKPKVTQEEFERRVKELFGDTYVVTGEYVSCMKHVRIRHAACGREFGMNPNNFYKGYGCPHCYRSYRKTTQEFRDEVAALVGDEYIVAGEYQTKKIKIGMLHRNCGKTFEMRPNDFLSNGNRCPHCATLPHDSKGVVAVREYLTSTGLAFVEEARFDGLRYKNPLRFDFCVVNPEDNSALVLIEFDGKQHFQQTFRSRTQHTLQKKRDAIKDEFAERHQIPFVRISYRDLGKPSFDEKLEKVQRLSREGVGA
jgi:hypothetical protein